MDVNKLKKLILSLTQDIEFSYDNIIGSIVPLSHDDISLSYGDYDHDYKDVDALLNDLVFCGKSLSDIANEIEVLN